MGQSLLDGSDASRVAAFDDVFDLFGKYQFLLLYDLTVFDDVDSDVVVDECQYIQIQHWTRELREAGKVEINQEVLKTVNNN